MKALSVMEVFNRIVVILIFAGLYTLGVFMVLHAFDFGGYVIADVPGALGLTVFYELLVGFAANLDNGSLGGPVIGVLGLIALVGLILLVLELKPPGPRRVRMQRGTYMTRRALKEEVDAALEQDPEVLGSKVKVKARRRSGAKVDIRANIRTGENAREIQSGVQDRIQQRLDRAGTPVGSLKVRTTESDPRETETRVR